MNNNDSALTDQKYWGDYYGTKKVDSESVIKICSSYDPYWEKAISKIRPPVKDLIEIGGFPGRYLAYLAWKYNLNPVSLDFNSNTEQIIEHFRAFGIDDYSILNENFLSFEPKKKFDLVLSNGFIEHFKDHDAVLDLHVKYMKPGGVLIVMIPNMKGFIKPYKLLLDKENLLKHSLDCMQLSVFRRFAERNNLDLFHAAYFGDFPFNVHAELVGWKKYAQRTSRLFFKHGLSRIVKKYPSPYFSSSIVAMLQK